MTENTQIHIYHWNKGSQNDIYLLCAKPSGIFYAILLFFVEKKGRGSCNPSTDFTTHFWVVTPLLF